MAAEEIESLAETGEATTTTGDRELRQKSGTSNAEGTAEGNAEGPQKKLRRCGAQIRELRRDDGQADRLQFGESQAYAHIFGSGQQEKSQRTGWSDLSSHQLITAAQEENQVFSFSFRCNDAEQGAQECPLGTAVFADAASPILCYRKTDRQDQGRRLGEAHDLAH